MKMTREEVVSALKIEVKDFYENNGNELGDDSVVMDITTVENALALLETQEPRVMTLEEVKTELVCWIEDVEAEVVFPAIYHCKGNPSKDGQYAIFATIQDSDILPEDYDDEQIIYQFDDGSRWLWEGNINKTWRPWTSRPTDAQRETKPWQ